MTVQEKYNLTMLTILLAVLVFDAVITYRRYRKYKTALMAHQNATIVSPSMPKFLFYGFVYVLLLSIPGLLLFWVIEPEHQMFWGYVISLPVLWLMGTISAHPYFALSIHNSKIEGARSLSLSEQRIEIDFREINKEKTLRQNLLHRLGIIIFHSVSGDKILTIGLNDLQVSQVLGMGFNAEIK